MSGATAGEETKPSRETFLHFSTCGSMRIMMLIYRITNRRLVRGTAFFHVRRGKLELKFIARWRFNQIEKYANRIYLAQNMDLYTPSSIKETIISLPPKLNKS